MAHNKIYIIKGERTIINDDLKKEIRTLYFKIPERPGEVFMNTMEEATKFNSLKDAEEKYKLWVDYPYIKNLKIEEVEH